MMLGILFTAETLPTVHDGKELTCNGYKDIPGAGGVAAPNSNGCTVKHCLQLSYSSVYVYEQSQKKLL